MFPCFAVDSISDCSDRNSVRTGQFCPRRSQRSFFSCQSHGIICQLGMIKFPASQNCAVPLFVSGVLGRCRPVKVVESVIERVSVFVRSVVLLARRGSMKRLTHKAIYFCWRVAGGAWECGRAGLHKRYDVITLRQSSRDLAPEILSRFSFAGPADAPVRAGFIIGE